MNILHFMNTVEIAVEKSNSNLFLFLYSLIPVYRTAQSLRSEIFAKL